MLAASMSQVPGSGIPDWISNVGPAGPAIGRPQPVQPGSDAADKIRGQRAGATITGELRALDDLFPLLEGKSGVAAAWERLVGEHLVLGKHAHDAHLVAIMQIYAVTDILTFNVAGFRRLPGIQVLDPAQF